MGVYNRTSLVLMNVVFVVAVLVIMRVYSDLQKMELQSCHECVRQATTAALPLYRESFVQNSTVACLNVGTAPGATWMCKRRFHRVAQTAWCQQIFLRRMQGVVIEPMLNVLIKVTTKGGRDLDTALRTRSVDEMKRRSDELNVCVS